MTVFAEGGQLKALYLDNEAMSSGILLRSTRRRRASSASRVQVRASVSPTCGNPNPWSQCVSRLRHPGMPEAFTTYLEAITCKVK